MTLLLVQRRLRIRRSPKLLLLLYLLRGWRSLEVLKGAVTQGDGLFDDSAEKGGVVRDHDECASLGTKVVFEPAPRKLALLAPQGPNYVPDGSFEVKEIGHLVQKEDARLDEQ